MMNNLIPANRYMNQQNAAWTNHNLTFNTWDTLSARRYEQDTHFILIPPEYNIEVIINVDDHDTLNDQPCFVILMYGNSHAFFRSMEDYLCAMLSAPNAFKNAGDPTIMTYQDRYKKYYETHSQWLNLH